MLAIICKCKSSKKKNQISEYKKNTVKGIVHLNIIFSYMKVNKKCNLDHPVY